MPRLRLLYKDGNPLVHVHKEDGAIDEVMYWNLGAWLHNIMGDTPYIVEWVKL